MNFLVNSYSGSQNVSIDDTHKSTEGSEAPVVVLGGTESHTGVKGLQRERRFFKMCVWGMGCKANVTGRKPLLLQC